MFRIPAFTDACITAWAANTPRDAAFIYGLFALSVTGNAALAAGLWLTWYTG
jgi:hypothetical protein